MAGIRASGLTAQRIAVTSGMDPGTLSRALTGQAVPDLSTVIALEHTLNTNLWPGLTLNSQRNHVQGIGALG